MKRSVTFRLDEGLLDRVDSARGDVPRTRWVVRALESALGGAGREVDDLPGASTTPSASVPPPEVSAKPKVSRAGAAGCSECGALNPRMHQKGCSKA